MAQARYVASTYNSSGVRLNTYAFQFLTDALNKVTPLVGSGGVVSYRVVDSWKMDMVPPIDDKLPTTPIDTTGFRAISDPTINENTTVNVFGVASNTWPT